MAGLFNMPTPEAVRQEARDRLFKQAVATSQGGFQQQRMIGAGQAGGLLGRQLSRSMGQAPAGESQAAVAQQVQQELANDPATQGLDLTNPEDVITFSKLAADKFSSMGQTELANKALAQGITMREKLPKQADSLSQLVQVPGAPDGYLGQFNRTTGEWDIKVKPGKGQNINVNTNQNPYEKALGKQFETAVDNKETAIKSIGSAETLLDLLDKPMNTGATAGIRTSIGALMKDIGMWDDKKNLVDNTQTYMAAAGKQTAQVIKDFGAGTGLSDADREYAQKIAGGNINVTADALRDINRLNIVASVNSIQAYNRQLEASTLPPERKEALRQRIPPKYQKIADKYNKTYGATNMPSVRGFEPESNSTPEMPPLSEADKQALQWAKANPNDPRADKIIQRVQP